MLFTSWTFVVFLGVVFALYYAGRSAVWQVGVLTVGSFVFYGWPRPEAGGSGPWLVLLLVASTTINAEVTRRLLAAGGTEESRSRALTFALAANLGALAFFKYAALLGRLLLPSSLWSRWGLSLEAIPLPVGISFYTFQGISLVMDAYRAGPRGMPALPAPERGWGQWRELTWFHGRVWFFKAFFPQLIAGPIVKASEFLHQIGAKSFARIDWNGAVRKLIAGLFLKMVVADNLKEATAALSSPLFLALPKVNLVVLLYGFSMQIFADFAGYSLIAIGLARLFGYELPVNFLFPYLSASITEFWRRWHLSLSSWLREYLYIPLGGNRRGATRTYVNLFLVMFLGGLWHGAAWSFAVWGTAHGLLLALERFMGWGASSDPSDEGRPWTALRVLRMVVTFHVVSLLWLLFKLPNFSEVLVYLRCLWTNPGGIQPQGVFVIALFSFPVLVYHVAAATSRWRVALEGWLGASGYRRAATLGYAFLLFWVIVNSGTPGEFIYFQF